MACYSPARLTLDGVFRFVPCRTCLGCRISYSRTWALRCLHESKGHADNCFVTLTYDDSHIKYGSSRPSLFKRDLQLFFKRLRKEGYNVRYFACGEYGDNTLRPHYHACLFGVDFSDKVLYSKSRGNDLFSSLTLDRIWGQGNCLIGEMCAKSAAYVARYCLKKLTVDSRYYYKDERIEPEFLVMSRRPGIGNVYFNRFNSDMFILDKCITDSGDYAIPRYYSNLLRSIDIDLFTHVKAMRAERQHKTFVKNGRLFGYSRSDSQSRLDVRAAVKAAQLRVLTRSL